MDDTPLTDDYVASLLAKDAKESSIKYSAMGMDAFLQAKPPANKPKPNTRFLRTIIKETDTHNAALLAKEAAESKARLETLVTKDKRSVADIRKRQLGHITAHLTGGAPKRRRREETENLNRRRTTFSDEDESGKDRTDSRRSDQSRRDHKDGRDGERSSHRSYRHRSRSDERHGKLDSRRERRGNSRSRSRSPMDHRSKDSRHRHRSPHRSSQRDKDIDKKSHRRHPRSPSPIPSSSRTKDKYRSQPATEDYDSDPLDDIIGPRPRAPPQILSRGRGLTSSASGIDQRFSSNYDPTSDVALDLDEENDWEQALEALRDRQKWKQQGADRLRAAGFTEEEVKKWESSGKEKTSEDVKWAKRGEMKEWDRGKVVGADGIFGTDGAADEVSSSRETDMDFGRLK